MRMRRVATAAALAAVTAGLLSGCALLSGPDDCLPGLSVTPNPAVAGETVTVTAEECDVSVPDEGWTIVLGHAGGGPIVTESTTQAFDGTFELTVELPPDFPDGPAYVDVANWVYVPCDDTGSCASAERPFDVIAP